MANWQLGRWWGTNGLVRGVDDATRDARIRRAGGPSWSLMARRASSRGRWAPGARVIQRGGVDDLRHVTPDPCELDHRFRARGILVGRRPEPGHELIGDTAAQEPAHSAEHLVEVTVQLVVDELPIELIVGPSKKPSSDTDSIKPIFRIARALSSDSEAQETRGLQRLTSRLPTNPSRCLRCP